MDRKERKEKADKRRLEIARSLQKYMKEVAESISDESIKADPHRRWAYILKKGDEWVGSRIKLFPQEAHMYRSAAIMVKDGILEVLKELSKKSLLKEKIKEKGDV